MAIKITEDGNVMYENEPSVERELLPNITDGEQYAKEAEEALERIEEIAESVPEDYTQLSEDVGTLEDRVTDLEEDVEELQNNYTPLSEDVSELKNDLNQISEHNKNLIAGYLPYALGIVSETSAILINSAGTTLYFPCEQGKTYTFSTSGATNRHLLAFFSSVPSLDDVTTYSDNTSDPPTTFTAPISGICCFYVKNAEDPALLGLSQFEVGDKATSYVAPKLIAVDTIARETAFDAFVTETETGSIASFTDGADDVPVKDLTVAIEPVQSGSGDPSPSNVRPISGWTGANVTRAGGNLLNPVAKFAGFWAPAVGTHLNHLVDDYSSFSNDTITVMSPEWNGNGFASTPLVEGKQYKITGEINAVNPRCSFVMTDADMNVTRTLVNRVETGNVNTLFTVASGEKYVVFSLINVSGDTGVTFKNPSVSESGVYEPYQGDTYSVDWTTEAGTVYGGTLDVTTGVLTVDRNVVQIPASYWNYNSNHDIFWSRKTDNPILANLASPIDGGYDVICSAYKHFNGTQYANVVDGEFSVGLSSYSMQEHFIILKDTRFTTTEDFRASSGIENVSFEIPLATLQTYQLTPQEVNSVLGQNNIFADCGSVNVQYRADTKLYIDKVLSA